MKINSIQLNNINFGIKKTEKQIYASPDDILKRRDATKDKKKKQDETGHIHRLAEIGKNRMKKSPVLLYENDGRQPNILINPYSISIKKKPDDGNKD